MIHYHCQDKLFGNMFGCLRFCKFEKEEEGFALVNQGRILEHLINSFNGQCNPFGIFSKQELTIATNNFNQSRILHNDLTYTLYRGSHEGREICVKKFTASSVQDEFVAWYVNEVVVASQLSKHKNVLKFLGCCLETQLPALVYEFAGKGSLSDHLFDYLSPLSWESRLRIASEIAEAIAYLHEGVSKVIIHRDIKTRNIFLDQKLVVKLFEFGLSLPVPLGEQHVDAEVIGSVGFIAPESHATGRFTDKSDVYSFGAVLFEILTGKKAWNILHEELGVEEKDSISTSSSARRGLTIRAHNCNWDERDEEVDEEVESYLRNAMTICGHGNNEQQMECVKLALRCLKLTPDQRPTIKEVAIMLQRIRRLFD